MRFHEIRTKSALNRVPGASRLPFAWTVNPYRDARMRALTACGRHADPARRRADARDRRPARRRRIYGTERDGTYRRYVTTEVLAHWSTVKPAYRVTLADGTELVASGDHRFLSRPRLEARHRHRMRRDSRPHLTLNDRFVGTGQFAAPPVEDADYRRGYLCGMVRGDAHLGSYATTAPERTVDASTASASRSPTSRRSTARTSTSPNSASRPTSSPSQQRRGYRAMRAIRTQRRASVEPRSAS